MSDADPLAGIDPESLVARRRRFIERQIAAHPERVDVRFQGHDPQGEGPPNRHGMPLIPVGQHSVAKWPVLDLGHHPEIAREDWRLELGGSIENPVTLDWDALMELPQVSIDADFHCVTTWSKLDMTFGGVSFRDLAALAVPKDEARFVFATGYDVAPGSDVPYTTNLPLERALDPDVMIVHTVDGEPLAREHGGPVRMVTPRLYAWKGTKWIRRIEFLPEDRLGFWELRGYSNTAEPWFDDRYSA